MERLLYLTMCQEYILYLTYFFEDLKFTHTCPAVTVCGGVSRNAVGWEKIEKKGGGVEKIPPSPLMRRVEAGGDLGNALEDLRVKYPQVL